MAINKIPFDWFERDLMEIRSRGFHILEPVLPEDLRYNSEIEVAVTGDYAVFLEKFGYARLFTDYRDAPVVSIYPLKRDRRFTCDDGKSYIGFAFRGGQSVFFEEAAIVAGEASRVFSVSKKKATELYPGFSEWFFAAYTWAKSKYSAKQWASIVKGPAPFSEQEVAVVDARRHFEWKLVGFSDDGDALIEVSNNSTMVLPYLTIGVSGVGQTILVGGAWLDIGHIKPGSRAVVKVDCYKDQIPADLLELFPRPDPIPEKKEAYWEFGKPV